MAFVRTFLVNIIPNEVTIEQFRDSMEYLGSICRIDKSPYLSDDNKSLGWNAFVYYESWKSCEATTIIDENLANPRRRNVLCFIEPFNKVSTGSVDIELVTPTITVYPLLNVQTQNIPINNSFWLLCRNTSSHQYSYIPNNQNIAHKLIRFIPKNRNLEISIPNKTDGTQWEDLYIINKIQSLKMGEIVYMEKSKVLYDKLLPLKIHEQNTKLYIQFKNWYVSEFTFALQERITKYDKAEVQIELGEPNWDFSYSNELENNAPTNIESWVRPNQHLYFQV